MPKLHLALTQLKFRSGSGSGEAVQTGQDIETWHSSANRWKLAGMISMLLRLKSCSAKLLMFVVFLKLLEAQTRKTTCHLNLASWPHMSLESFHHHEVWRQHRPNKTPAIQRQHAHCRLWVWRQSPHHPSAPWGVWARGKNFETNVGELQKPLTHVCLITVAGSN